MPGLHPSNISKNFRKREAGWMVTGVTMCWLPGIPRSSSLWELHHRKELSLASSCWRLLDVYHKMSWLNFPTASKSEQLKQNWLFLSCHLSTKLPLPLRWAAKWPWGLETLDTIDATTWRFKVYTKKETIGWEWLIKGVSDTDIGRVWQQSAFLGLGITTHFIAECW